MFLHVGERTGQPPTLHVSGELADVFRQSALADAIDKKVTVRLATKSNEAFMAIPFRTFTTLQFGERIPSQSNTENRESAKLCVVAETPAATLLMRRSPKSGHFQPVVPFGIMLWPTQFGLGWQGEHVLARVHRHRFLPSTTGSVRCISRISACVRFEIFHVGPADRYITLQNRMSLASPVGYSGVYGQFGPHSRRRR